MADWEEIKKLAADFQRVQTADTLERLSERNCIDLIKKLIELKMIEVIHTVDGKQFVTPEHLLKEIEDEVYVNSGRIHYHELASKLRVDYQQIEDMSKKLGYEYKLVSGQIIHSNYDRAILSQITETLSIEGHLSLAEFAKTLDLPTQYLSDVINSTRQDEIVTFDGMTLYSVDMMARYKSIIAGTLSAITKPHRLDGVMKRLDIPERIFNQVADGLIKDGRIDGIIENKIFTPSIYSRAQNDWIDKFYQSNQYIEFDVLTRMGIKQSKAFLKRRFPDSITLKSCIVNKNIISQLEGVLEETVATSGWMDTSDMVPIDREDLKEILAKLVEKNKQIRLLDDTTICSLGFIDNLRSSFRDLMILKARKDLDQGRLMNYFLGGNAKPNQPKRQVQDISKQQSQQDISNDKENQSQSAKSDSKVEESTTEQENSAISPEETPSTKLQDKGKKSARLSEDFGDSDDDQVSGKKHKGRKSAGGSGGGSQGREIKQKSVKKKYIPGMKGNQKKNDPGSDDDSPLPTKTPRSAKGRAARRELSPDERPQSVSSAPSTSSKSKRNHPKETPQVEKKEPLTFMTTDELLERLRNDVQRSGDCSDEFLESLVKEIESDINDSYMKLAREELDNFMKAQEEENIDDNDDGRDDNSKPNIGGSISIIAEQDED